MGYPISIFNPLSPVVIMCTIYCNVTEYCVSLHCTFICSIPFSQEIQNISLSALVVGFSDGDSVMCEVGILALIVIYEGHFKRNAQKAMSTG